MRTPAELKEIAEKMQTFLEVKPGTEPNDLIDRAENLSALIAKSGHCLADAKYNLDMRKNDSITLALKEAMAGDWSISIIHKKIDALCREENYLVNCFDRINSAAVHQLDGVRTIISYRKAEMTI